MELMRRGNGYSRDLTIKKPAVIDLNMRSASYGMMVDQFLGEVWVNERG